MAKDLAVQMLQMAGAKFVTKPLYVAAKLGVADLLADGPRDVADLARETKTHAPSLYRVLRALSAQGVFTEVEPRRFGLTPLAELIRSGENTMRAMVLWLNDPRHDHIWEFFLHSVKTGEPAVEPAFGASIFEYLGRTPDLLQIFQAAMTNNANNLHAAAAEAYDFSPIRHLVDVGGGHGTLMTRVLSRYPDLRGTVYDLPKVIEGAKQQITAAKLAARCEVEAGDFFESVPDGDAHILSFIIHDWDDEKCLTILRNIHRAQKPGGKLLVVEMVVPDGNEPSFAKLLDMEMLALPGGRERTAGEFRALFQAAGFQLSRIVGTHSPCSVIEGTRA